MNQDTLMPQLILHEGVRLNAYLDTMGILTIGVGRNVIANPTEEELGRAISKVGDSITEEEAMLLLSNDIDEAVDNLTDEFDDDFDKLSEPRQHVLIDMCFNMGIGIEGKSGLLAFQNMLDATFSDDYPRAAHEMLNSRWAKQVRRRATLLSLMMEQDLSFEDARKQLGY
ncbi:MAG: glycoside hydrolase family protein [Thiotrichaceae bacterium]|nr:glycoside hydrolase family protein [Thiotrichaceae bacterium]